MRCSTPGRCGTSRGHPKVGASWEGFVLGELIAHLGLAPHEMYFWGTHAGAELDLLVLRGNRRLGFEMKRTPRPATTRSMRSAIDTLGLDEPYVIHAGDESFALAEGARAVALPDLVTEVSPG